MATYGIYQVLDPLYVTPTGSVCSAKIVGGEAEGRVVAKVFNPPVADPDEPNWEPKYFLDRAQVQRRVAASGGAHWAPIYASGFTPEGGAYYVTDYHALTAHKLIEGRVPVDATSLHAIVSSVVAGLEEIQRVAGRSHANLKPSNVLLIGKGKLEELRALLCDPGQEYKAQKDGEPGDLHALGALIHDLVLHRPAGAPHDPAVTAVAPEWARLGDKADAWRQLCLDLLSQPIPPRAASLAAVSKGVAGLAPPRVKVPQFRLPGAAKRAAAAAAAEPAAKPAKAAKAPRTRRPRGPGGSLRVRRLAVQALAVLLLVGGGLFVFSAMEASAREEVCRARGDWLGPLTAGLAEPQRRERFESDPHLRRVVEAVDEVQRAGVRCDGGRIQPLGFLQYADTRDAAATVRQVERDLAPESWPRLQRLRELAATFEKRGWQQPAAYVAQLVEGVRPTPATPAALSRPSAPPAKSAKRPPDDLAGVDADGESALPATSAGAGAGSLAARVDRVLRVQPTIEEQAPAAAAEWDRLARAAGQLEQSTDPVVRGFGGVLRAHGLAAVRLTDEGFDGLPALAEDARLATEVIAAIAADATRPLDAERFNREVVARYFNAGDLQPGDVQNWLDKRPLYAVRTEDRAREAKRLAEQFGAMRAKVENSAPDPAEQAAFAQAQKEVQVALREFKQTPFIAADLDDGGGFHGRVKQIEGQIAKLNQYYHTEDPADWLANLQALPTSSERVKRAWGGWVARLREDARAMAERRELFARHKKRTDDLQAALTVIDLLPQPPEKLSVTFQAAAAKRREERVGELLERVDTPDPSLDPDAFEAARESLDAWYRKLSALNADFPIPAKRLLTLEDRPDEAWRRRDETFWRDPLVRQLVRADLDRIQRLQKLRTADRAALVKHATDDGPRNEVVVAAWRLLGDPAKVRPSWPNTVAELKAEQALRERVGAVAQTLGDFERATLQDALDNEGPRRWRRFVEAITPEDAAEEKLAEARARWREFNVENNDIAEMDPPARFNFWLHIVKTNARIGNANRKAVQDGIDSLMEAAEALEDGQATRGAAVREKLAKLAAPEPFAGREMGAVFALPVEGLARPIEFRRVEPKPESGGRPFYLGSTEVTLGQFVAALRATRQWDESMKLDWPALPGKPDPRRGARVWEWWADPAATSLNPARLWMADHAKHNDFPNEFRERKFNRTVIGPAFGGMPSEDHPMQYVTPQAALFYAAALGCRLPTSAEWRTALEASGQSAADGRWNLRDRTWETFRAYAARESIPANRWPDADSFQDGGGPRAAAAAPPPGGKADDATFLFRPAPSAGGDAFHDLVGNVAEYVCERPDEFDRWADKGTADGVKRFLGETPAPVAVIGGSALSAPDVPLVEPLPLRRAHRAFSDVGLRLAFTAPAQSLAERLKWVLAGEQYLPPVHTASARTTNGEGAGDGGSEAR